MDKERLWQVVSTFAGFFKADEVPDDFSFSRQSFYERCEAWILHAIEQVETELAAFKAEGDPESDEQPEQGGPINDA